MSQALIDFHQGASSTVGQAMEGVAGTPVTVSNDNDASPTTIVNWNYFVIDSPPGSSLPRGLAQNGATPTWTFTPDLPNGYQIQLTTTDAAGGTATDIRTFVVPRTSGRKIPPFQGTNGSMNVAAQTRGWAPYMETWLEFLDSIKVPLFFAGLASRVPDTSRQFEMLDGYSTSGDGGGGKFVWNATDTRVNNGGTIVKVTSIATGRWNRVYSGPLNARWFGCKGDGITDDTTSVQAFLTWCIANGVHAYFPAGVYLISSTILLTFGVSPSPGFMMTGDLGTTYPSVSSFKWVGALGGTLFEQQGGTCFHCEHLDFNGNGLASECYFVPSISGRSSISCKFLSCGFTSPRPTAFWQAGNIYTAGEIVTGPNTGDLLSNRGVASNNGYLYQCTVGGTSASPGPASTWTTTLSATQSDNTVTWECIGYVPAAFRVGTSTADGYEVSEYIWEHCFFVCDGNRSGSGWRQQSNANVKNFSFNHCTFESCGFGIDVAAGSGSYIASFPIFSDNGAADINFNGDNLTVTGLASEGSGRLLVGAGGTSINLIGGYWTGFPLVYAGYYPVIFAQASITAVGFHFSSTVVSTGVPVVITVDNAANASPSAPASYTSIGCTYDYSSSLLVTDTAGISYKSASYAGTPVQVTSLNDNGNSSGISSSSIPFSAFIGNALTVPALNLRKGTLTLANGNNDDVAIPAGIEKLNVTGPTASCKLRGLDGGVDGRRVELWLTYNFATTLSHLNAGSTQGNRIATPTAGDTVIPLPGAGGYSVVLLEYDSTVDGGHGGWRVVS